MFAEHDHLSSADIIRPGAAHDADLIARLLATGRRVYSMLEADQIAGSLAYASSAFWLRGQTLLGAVAFDHSRRFVATASLLTVRYANDQALFFRRVLPYAERLSARSQACWACFDSPSDWLIAPLRDCGYTLHTRLVTYHKADQTLPSFLARHTQNQSLSVRKADHDDAPALLRLDSDAFEPFWQLNEQFVFRATQDDCLLVAVCDERIAGYLLAQACGAEAHVARLGVARSDRGRGIGARLMIKAISILTRQGASSFWLNTQEDNQISRQFYEKLGFQPVAEVRELWAKPLAVDIAEF